MDHKSIIYFEMLCDSKHIKKKTKHSAYSILRHFVVPQQHKNTYHVQAITNYLFQEAVW